MKREDSDEDQFYDVDTEQFFDAASQFYQETPNKADESIYFDPLTSYKFDNRMSLPDEISGEAAY